MPWEFTEHHVRPNVFYWSPTAYNERNEVKTRRDQAQAAYKEAKKASSDGRHADAERLLLHCVTAWPDNHRYSLALAHCIFLEGGRPEEALEWYNEVVRLKDCPAHRAARSRVLAALGQLEAALEDMCVAAEGEPQNPGYAVSRAMLRERLGHFAAARDDYTAALPLLRAASQPVFESLFNRGYCHKMLGDVDAAIHDLEAALLQSTASMTVRTVLGVLYLSRRRYLKALDLFSVVSQQQTASASAANNSALAAYLAVTSDFDDSTAATRAASLYQQRARAAMLATGSIKRREARGPATDAGAGAEAGAGGEGGRPSSSSRSATPIPPIARRSLAAVVRKAREAAAAAAATPLSAAVPAAVPAGSTSSWGSSPTTPTTGAVSERPDSASRGAGSFRTCVSLPPLAALLDEAVAADQGPLLPTRPRTSDSVAAATATKNNSRPRPRSRPGPGPGGEGGGAGPDSPDSPDGSSLSPSSSDSESDDGGPGGGGRRSRVGGGGPEVPTVYLPANPRQWAVDIVRSNEVQTVWEPDRKAMLDQALRGFDRAISNQRALAARRKAAGGGSGGGSTGQIVRHGREELDLDTTALEVGEAGDVPGGLLLVLLHEPRLPGAAAVHDREVEDGEIEYNR
ncbi:hypothetical protein PLESTF_000741300, partial [Pleodorina starrii]